MKLQLDAFKVCENCNLAVASLLLPSSDKALEMWRHSDGERGACAYNGGLDAEPPPGFRNRPLVKGQGRRPRSLKLLSHGIQKRRKFVPSTYSSNCSENPKV